MKFFKLRQPYLSLLVVLEIYVIGYAIARSEVFHTVENYPEGKDGSRQDYIAKKDQRPGEGWEYKLFLPAIKVEETVVNYIYSLQR